MNTVVWILAGIYVANVALVAVFILFLEVRRRRAQRELRELESLWQAPSAAPVHAERSGGVRIRARPTAPPGRESQRRGLLRAASYALAVASVAAVTLAALLPPSSPDGRSLTSAEAFDGVGSIPRLPGDLARLSGDLRRGEEGAETDEIPGGETSVGTDIVISGIDETVSAVVAAQPASSTAIRLRWAEVPAATGYRIERQDEAEATDGEPEPWVMIATKPAGVSTHTDTGLEAATTYFYRVTAMLEVGPAPASDVVSATTPVAPPVAPTITATLLDGAIALSWSDVEGETGYRVERLAEGETHWTPIATTGEGIAVYEDGGLTPGASYHYRVIATGVGGDSEPSNVVDVVAPGGTTPSESPQPDQTPDAVEPDPNTPDAIDPSPEASG